jgi:hypothetical protein
MIKIYDDVLSKNEINHLETLFRSPLFPWFLSSGENNHSVELINVQEDADINSKESIILVHTFYIQEKKNSDNFAISDFIFNKFLSYTKIPFKKLLRSKANFHPRSNITDPNLHTTPHVDYKHPHSVLIYYVTDSDGTTIIFDRKLHQSKTEYNIIQEIEPKAGRFLLFDGEQYHAARHPINSETRINVNFNFL